MAHSLVLVAVRIATIILLAQASEPAQDDLTRCVVNP